MQKQMFKSRVREGDGLLLVQPYSPELFRLGDLPGPRLLMEALRGKATPQELKKEWKAVEKEKQSGQTRQGTLRRGPPMRNAYVCKLCVYRERDSSVQGSSPRTCSYLKSEC